MFENKPERCPFGHRLWPGKCQVSWTPCICEPAREAAERGRGMGHVRVSCNRCHDELRQTLFYEPPHDVGHGPLTGWTSSPLRRVSAKLAHRTECMRPRLSKMANFEI